MKLEVGSLLYTLNRVEYKILKVGRKWFTAMKTGEGAFEREIRIDIDSLESEPNYLGARVKFYADRNVVDAHIEKRSHIHVIQKRLRTLGFLESLSLEDLKAIYSIIRDK